MQNTYNKAFLCSLCLHLLLVPIFLSLINVREEHMAPKDNLIELEMVSLGAGEKEAGEEGKSGGSGPLKEIKAEKPEPKMPEPPQLTKQTVKAVKPIAKSEVRTRPTKESRNFPAKPANNASRAENSASGALSSGGNAGSGGSGSGLGSGTGHGTGDGTGSGNSGSGTGGGGTGSSSGGGGLPKDYIPPQILARVEPKYPASAREQGITGTVKVRVQVMADGSCGSVNVRQSSGSSMLDQAAVDAVKRWRFVPAKDRNTGRAFSCFTSFPVSFRLK